jgi:hypothetical protein
MSSWRAIERSHRPLDRKVYKLERGELHVIEGPMPSPPGTQSPVKQS